MKVAKSLGAAKTLAWQMGAESRARMFVKLCAKEGIPEPEREVQFHPPRRWLADFLWSQSPQPVILESHGGRWGAGLARRHGPTDWEKANEAQIDGYIFLQVSADELLSEATIALVKRGLGGLTGDREP